MGTEGSACPPARPPARPPAAAPRPPREQKTVIPALGDGNMRNLQKGDVLQLERKVGRQAGGAAGLSERRGRLHPCTEAGTYCCRPVLEQ